MRHQHVADLLVGDRQIALPLRVAGVGGGETLSDGKAVAVRLERLVELALRHQHVADILVGDRQIALPLRVAAIGGGEALPDGEAVAIGFERLIELALSHQHVADFVVARPTDRAANACCCGRRRRGVPIARPSR